MRFVKIALFLYLVIIVIAGRYVVMAQPKKRVTSDITDIDEMLQKYPQYADDIDEEAWEMLTDAQKLVYLAKKQLNQVRGKKAKEDAK